MERDLVKGKIGKSIFYFSLPLIFGNLLQQLYNMVDTYVVGKYVGSNALAAVGASYSLLTFLTSIIIGLCMGSGVLLAMYYGGNEFKKLKNALFVSFISIGFITVVLEIVCFVFIDNILVWLNIPQEIFILTKDYLKIIFSGIVFVFIYNYFASLLRSLGDSKIPLVFLVVSTIINVILDLIFVLYFKMAVRGVAIATLISQIISAISIALYVLIIRKEILPKKEDCYYDYKIFKRISDYSLMTCLQQGIMNFGILMIQGLVNSFGLSVMAAFSACVKIDSFAYLPVQDFGNAFATFVAQNKGANKLDRINKGVNIAFIMESVFSIFISILVNIFARELLMIFVSEQDIILIGMKYLQIEGSFYLGIGCLFLLYGYYRGMGKMKMSLILTIVSLGTRVLLAYVLAPVCGYEMIWWAIVIGWFLADMLGIVYGFKKEGWKINGIND